MIFLYFVVQLKVTAHLLDIFLPSPLVSTFDVKILYSTWHEKTSFVLETFTFDFCDRIIPVYFWWAFVRFLY